MKTSIFAAALAAAIRVTTASSGAEIGTTAVPTTCGQQDCCIPSCQLTWSDGNGCTDGQATTAGACSDAFVASSTTSDTGVDICNGGGAFFCYTDGGVKVVYVVNRENVVSAQLFPAVYNECTLSGQCAPCTTQGSCQAAAVNIGTSTTHSCSVFDALLTSSNVDLQPC